MRTPIIYAIATILVVGIAFALNGAALTRETFLDAFALVVIITILSLQSWLRRRYMPPRGPGAGLPPMPHDSRLGHAA